MRNRFFRSTVAVTFWLLASAPAAAFAQDPALLRAKGLYASADYEEALQVLQTLKGKPASTEADAYQVFCLVALGRKDEAKAAVEAIVRVDPLYRPAEGQVSPRIRTFFDDVRRPLLPEIVRTSYGKAKTSYDKKDWAPALKQFDQVIALLDELGGAEQGSADLRTLASGFRDLTKSALLPPPPPPPAPTPTPTSTPAPSAPPAIYTESDATVTRPVSISQMMPPWYPSTIEAKMSFSGAVSLVIGEDGKVLAATIAKSVNPRYDAPLLDAAKNWVFQPATKNGKPVRYQYVLTIKLEGK